MRFRELLPIILLVAGFAAGFLSGLVLKPSTLTAAVTEAEVRTVTVSFTEAEGEISLWATTVTATITTTPLDSDSDGIPDLDENRYGTDPDRPNYLLAYALKRLPESEALRFRNVENFDENSKVLVDLYAKLPQDKRCSEQVSDLINQILLDNVISEPEKSLFDDRFVNSTLPEISDLAWIPARENLDKIYDINVTFIAEDDKTPIAYAELRFIPVEYHYMVEKYGMRPEDYPKVFPPDKERFFILTPIDGEFDSLEERFSVPIKDIVGGREYKIVALVKDLAGNERTVEVKMPYMRQFENIAEKDDVTISVLYLLWWGKDDNWKDYRGGIFPLLGKYSSKDTIVINKHIDWATGHGIDLFLVQWSGIDYQDEAFKSHFLGADLVKRGDIKFAVLYETIWRLKILIQDGISLILKILGY